MFFQTPSSTCAMDGMKLYTTSLGWAIQQEVRKLVGVIEVWSTPRLRYCEAEVRVSYILSGD